jgi:predicted RNA-binding protein (virulence factor B family)
LIINQNCQKKIKELFQQEDMVYISVMLVSDGRINGNLNLSRAIGDLEYKKDKNLPPEKQIISAAPDIKKYV